METEQRVRKLYLPIRIKFNNSIWYRRRKCILQYHWCITSIVSNIVTFSSEMRLSGTEGTLNSAIFTHLSKYEDVRLESRRKAEAVATGSKNVKLSISLQTQSYIGFQHSLTTFVVADRGALGTEIYVVYVKSCFHCYY